MPVDQAMLERAELRERALGIILAEIGMQSASVEYVRPPSGPGYKELGLGPNWNWKAHLVTAPFEVRKWYELSMVYGGGTIRSVRLMRLTEGYNDYYLRAWCLLRNAVRIFSLRDVGPLLTEDSDIFESGASWLNSLPRVFSANPEQE
jgi:hypothetical protein